MMKRQVSFAKAESTGKKRVAKRQRFPGEMEKVVVTWPRLLSAIEPYYPKGERGRSPTGLERMPRIYFLQQWYGLSDGGLEDALYDSVTMRAFVGVDLAVENVPDATTLLNFRHRLVEHDLTCKLFDEIGISLREQGLMVEEGTLVDVMIVEAPSSTKIDQEHREEAETRRCIRRRKATGSIFRYEEGAHRRGCRLVAGTWRGAGTAANASDVSQAHALLHGHEKNAFSGAGYIGVDKRTEMKSKCVKWRVAVRRGKIKAM